MALEAPCNLVQIMVLLGCVWKKALTNKRKTYHSKLTVMQHFDYCSWDGSVKAFRILLAYQRGYFLDFGDLFKEFFLDLMLETVDILKGLGLIVYFFQILGHRWKRSFYHVLFIQRGWFSLLLDLWVILHCPTGEQISSR